MISISSLVNKDIKKIEVVIGTVVTTNLYALGRGVVYQIHGEQKPDTIKQIGNGVMVSGGNAEFDIVHECGKLSQRLTECILRGVQWAIYDEVISADEISRLRVNAEECADKEKRKKKKTPVHLPQKLNV